MNAQFIYDTIMQFDRTNIVPVLTGPTASGKTTLLYELSKLCKNKIKFEVVSADAFQIYKGMNIGTAKPSAEVLELLPHHLIDIRKPDEKFSAGEFVVLALDKINEIISNGKVPIVAGGTGFYISALVNGLHELPPADNELRNAALNKIELLQRLSKFDKDSAKELKNAPITRIIRRIEIVEGTGLTMEKIRHLPRKKSKYEYKIFKIVLPRNELHKRIEERTIEIFQKGFVTEVEKLRSIGIRSGSASQRAIGYREVHRYLDKEISEEEMKRLVERNTRRYAKRQETWFRHQLDQGDGSGIRGTEIELLTY